MLSLRFYILDWFCSSFLFFLLFFPPVLTDGWVCERADQDILVDMEMSSCTSAWQLQGDVRDCKTAFIWKGVPTHFVIAVIMMNIMYSMNLKLLGPQVIAAFFSSLIHDTT